MQNEKSKTKQGIRDQISRTENPTRLYPVVALNCCTVDNDRNSFFFLFSDIDDKDEYHLSRILKFFAFNGLTFYWFETSKGYRVLSPCLMTIESWDKMRSALVQIEKSYYRGINSRISRKKSDPHKQSIFFESSYGTGILESRDLHKLISKMFHTKYVDYDHSISTKLNFSVYRELELI